jgi:hypothetical protein
MLFLFSIFVVVLAINDKHTLPIKHANNHDFFKNYGQIVEPITTLLNKETFSWAMCTTPILTTHNFTKTFIMECDASCHGTGAFLMQEGRPLAFERNQLNEKSTQPIYEK